MYGVIATGNSYDPDSSLHYCKLVSAADQLNTAAPAPNPQKLLILKFCVQTSSGISKSEV